MGTNESLKAPGDLPRQETSETKTACTQNECPDVAESNEYFEQYKMQEPGIRSVKAKGRSLKSWQERHAMRRTGNPNTR